MVTVKRCPACGNDNDPQNLFCTVCPTSLVMVPITQIEDQSVKENSKSTDQPDLIECPFCNTKNFHNAITCIRCSMPLSRQPPQKNGQIKEKAQDEIENVTRREEPCQAVIRFPWGEEVVDYRLGIGRNTEHSSLAGQLTELKRVSRRHAEILREGSQFMICDSGSLNFTFVNGRQLTPGEAVELHPGDKLQFSSQLEAEVLEIRGQS